jgi:dihydrofolate reductase
MNVVLYIAASLDGYIADRDGGVGWLDRFTDPADGDYGYTEFYAGIGAVAMGRVTYEQVLGFGGWPYSDRPVVVFSHAGLEGEHPDVAFTSDDPADVVASLRDRVEGDLWLVGGGELIASFRARDLIDVYIITVIPMLLGEGIPLFPGTQPETSLQTTAVRHFESGIVQLHYTRG